MNWPALLGLHERYVSGEDDDFEVNGDPDSTLGEEDESGFDELAGDHPEEALADDGFDDAEGEDGDDDLDDDADDE